MPEIREDVLVSVKVDGAGAEQTLDNLSGGAASAAKGFLSMTKGALAFIATPIGAVMGALGLAIGALTAYFKSSEQAQNQLIKITSTFSAVLEQLMNFAEAAGEAIFNAFSNPKQAIKDIGQFLQDQLVNRFVGLLELIPNLGKAVVLLFKGQFSEAGKVAADAALKVGTGVENATDKIIKMAGAVKEAVDAGIKNGIRLADFQADIDKNQRFLDELRATNELKIGELRERALTEEGSKRKQTIGEAIKLIQNLANAEVIQAKQRLRFAELELKNNGNDKEALDKVSKATADLTRAEASRYTEAFKLRKQFEKLEEQELKAREKLIDQEFSDLEKRTEKNQEYYDKVAENITKHDEAEKKKSDLTALRATQTHLAQTAAQRNTNNTLAQLRKEDEADAKKHFESIIKFISDAIALITPYVKGVFDLIKGHYTLDENALAVSLANKKTLLNEQYAADLAALDQKLTDGIISQEEYDAALLTLNEKQKADLKAAEIEQAKAMNEIKRKQFEADKKSQIAEALINAAQAILKGFAQLGPIGGAIAAIATGILTAFQINQIKDQQFVPATFYDGGDTGRGNPRSISNAIGWRPYTYHKEEYVVPHQVYHSREGMYHVNALEAMRTGKRSFAVGGSTGGVSMEMFQAMVDKINNIQTILVLEDFERVSGRKAEVVEKSELT